MANPVPPVQPRMTKAQAEEMKDWFLKETWKKIMECLRRWRVFGASKPVACPTIEINLHELVDLDLVFIRIRVFVLTS